MKTLLFFVLRIFKKIRLGWLGLTGKTEEDLYAQRIVSGQSWEDFCDNLKTAGAALLYPGAPRDPFQQAEGVRYLSRLTRAALEAFVEYNDPAFPRLRRMVHETVKMGADNPDNYYVNAQISGGYEYRIMGKRNSVHYLGFFTQNGNYGTTGGLAPCGVLEHKDIQFEADGSFEVILSKTPKGKNWLKIEAETSMLMVRQTFLKRKEEAPAEMEIENLDGRKAPQPINPKLVDEGLKMAGLFVAGAPMLFSKWAKGFQKHSNELPLFDPEISNAAGGDAGIIYYHSHWKLGPGEALVIEAMPPECDSWNFQLNNYWMESLDYRYHNICISKGNAVYERDGRVRLIVAHENPGLPNWIETCAHQEGTMCWRWYRSEVVDPPQPNCRVVAFSDLKKMER